MMFTVFDFSSGVRKSYMIEAGKEKVAEVSKKWFQIRDTFGVEIGAGQDVALILTITAAMDQMAHD